jgi:hypothetical protein
MERLLLQALASLERFLDRRRRARSEQTAAHHQAVDSSLEAVRETAAYLYDLDRNGQRDRERERRFSRLWGTAAARVRDVDARLSRLAHLESFNWAEPEVLDGQDFEAIRTQLDLIRRQCEWLIRHWQ